MKKNNKKIINEINRLNQLMGLNKKLLNEQAWVDDLLTGLIEAGAKQGDEITTLTAKLSDDALTTLEKTDVLEDIIRIAQREGNDDLLRVINTQLIRSGGRLMNQLDDIIVKYRTLIQSGIDRGASKSDLQKMFVDDFNPNSGDDILDELIKRQLRTKIGKEYDELISVADDVASTTRVTDDATETGARETSDDTIENGTSRTEVVGDIENSIPNIEKSFNEIVDEITTEEIALINNKLTKWWGDSLERLKTSVSSNFKNSIKLQNEILEDIAIWKRATPNARPTIRKRIISKLKTLESKNKDLLESTDSWIESEIRPMAAKDRNVKIFYDKVKAREGWSKIKVLSNVFEGINLGIKDIFKNNKTLRTSWLKVISKPITIPVNLITRVVNKIFDKELKLIGKFTPEQSKAFKNWFITTNPAGWKAVRETFQNQGFFGGVSYITSQMIYRYLYVSTMIGIGRTLGAITSEGVDLAFDTNISDNPITNYLFGTSNLDELQKGLIENEGGTFNEYAEVLIDMISSQSEPFRNWIGMWPLAKVIEGTSMLIGATLDNTLPQKIQELESESEQILDDIKNKAEEVDVELPPSLGGTEEEGIDVSQTDDEDSIISSSYGIPNSLDGLSTQFGYPKDQMSPQTYNGTGEIEIWGMKFVYDSTNKKFIEK